MTAIFPLGRRSGPSISSLSLGEELNPLAAAVLVLRSMDTAVAADPCSIFRLLLLLLLRASSLCCCGVADAIKCDISREVARARGIQHPGSGYAEIGLECEKFQ